jgi:hypothetical protein
MKAARLLLGGLLLSLFMADTASGVRGSLNVNGEVERELTFEIAAGKEECFFETVQKGNIIDIEYQVKNTSKLNGSNMIAIASIRSSISFQSVSSFQLWESKSFRYSLLTFYL